MRLVIARDPTCRDEKLEKLGSGLQRKKKRARCAMSTEKRARCAMSIGIRARCTMNQGNEHDERWERSAMHDAGREDEQTPAEELYFSQ